MRRTYVNDGLRYSRTHSDCIKRQFVSMPINWKNASNTQAETACRSLSVSRLLWLPALKNFPLRNSQEKNCFNCKEFDWAAPEGIWKSLELASAVISRLVAADESVSVSVTACCTPVHRSSRQAALQRPQCLRCSEQDDDCARNMSSLQVTCRALKNILRLSKSIRKLVWRLFIFTVHFPRPAF